MNESAVASCLFPFSSKKKRKRQEDKRREEPPQPSVFLSFKWLRVPLSLSHVSSVPRAKGQERERQTEGRGEDGTGGR